MIYVALGIHLICLVQPDFEQVMFAFISFFILHLSLFHFFKIKSEYMDPFSPLPSFKARPHVICCSLEMSSSVTCCFQTLGSHNLAESNYSHQLRCGSLAASERSMAAAQPFPISIDADCIAHVCVLLHS